MEGRAHLVLEVFVGLRGEEEFHDFGVTVARGVHERRAPILLKERTERERERARREEGGSQQIIHITRVSDLFSSTLSTILPVL